MLCKSCVRDWDHVLKHLMLTPALSVVREDQAVLTVCLVVETQVK